MLSETLPWHVRYDSFAGTLPDITSVSLRVIGMALLVRPTGLLSCLYQTESGAPARLVAVRETIGVITSLRFEEASSIASRTPFCPNGVLSGSGGLTVLGESMEMMVFLEEAGEVLEPHQPGGGIQALVIRRPADTGVETLRNRTRVDMRVKAIFTSGTNEMRFSIISTEAEACRLNFVLRRNNGNSCTVRIRFDEGVARPVQTRVYIILEVGAAQIGEDFFIVRAEN